MHINSVTADPFHHFREGLVAGGHEGLRAGLIGKTAKVDGPFGPMPMLYADYVASGRALRQVECFMMEEVLPTYANTHTEASYSGARTTELREAARALIARHCGATEDHAVVFAGSGATAGLNRLVSLFNVPEAVAQGRPVLVFHGPYEHHSNILPWRESGATVVEVPEAPTGGPDLDALRKGLEDAPAGGLLIGTFSAASNVTGALSDVASVTRVLQEYGARSVWDYAGGGPYLPVSVHPARGVTIDAICLSPHKFVGGPGASGVLIVRRAACTRTVPSWPGGGTVVYVSQRTAQYSARIEDREEAGTPNILGDIRAGLAVLVKDVIGQEFLNTRQAELARLGLERLGTEPSLSVLGDPSIPRLPIFSFTARDDEGTPVHYQYATRLLSDLYGLQTRGGCACAGPYAHRLLDFGPDAEARIYGSIALGHELERPGFVRFNLSALFTDAEVERVLSAVTDLPRVSRLHRTRYRADPKTGMFQPVSARFNLTEEQSGKRSKQRITSYLSRAASFF
ncbi:aminotransferase class V-fold PLP-dependent enzyme [Litorisediminicola beolgyonensis]|uniref:Aminotransferase class V-fold PLP-dependent enzyme n=1 Tax=Litorisediminicola beolgyonensis TaxID=1173614 RepID=A0ABW3ZL46_9RHOB